MRVVVVDNGRKGVFATEVKDDKDENEEKGENKEEKKDEVQGVDGARGGRGDHQLPGATTGERDVVDKQCQAYKRTCGCNGERGKARGEWRVGIVCEQLVSAARVARDKQRRGQGRIGDVQNGEDVASGSGHALSELLQANGCNGNTMDCVKTLKGCEIRAGVEVGGGSVDGHEMKNGNLQVVGVALIAVGNKKARGGRGRGAHDGGVECEGERRLRIAQIEEKVTWWRCELHGKVLGKDGAYFKLRAIATGELAGR